MERTNPFALMFRCRAFVFTNIVCVVTLTSLVSARAVPPPPVLCTVLHTFTNSPSDGYQPLSILLGADNELYGITYGGGTNAQPGGTIFRAHRDGSDYSLLHSFDATTTGNSNSISSGYPTTQLPTYGGLSMILGSDGLLYGTTWLGGSYNQGTVFKLNRDGSEFTIVRNFGPTDAGPVTLTEGSDGALYGTTWVDGANADGTIFRLTKDGNTYTVLYNFNPAAGDGYRAIEPMTMGKDGLLYGSLYHGTNGSALGTIFKINPVNQTFTVLRHLSLGDGFHPSRLTQGSDGFLYGTTYTGPGTNYGSLFQMDTNGTVFNQLHIFTNSADGWQLRNGVIEGQDHTLYGAAYWGGTGAGNEQGTIYQFNVSTSAFQVLYNFNAATSSTGAEPYAPLVRGSSSETGAILFGTATIGGLGNGTLFSIVVNPPISITPTTAQSAGGPTTVFWPAWAQNYILQTSTNLDSPTNWTSVNGTYPQVIGVQLTNGVPGAYYRLVYPGP